MFRRKLTDKDRRNQSNSVTIAVYCRQAIIFNINRLHGADTVTLTTVHAPFRDDSGMPFRNPDRLGWTDLHTV
jgi:hypothetical protein